MFPDSRANWRGGQWLGLEWLARWAIRSMAKSTLQGVSTTISKGVSTTISNNWLYGFFSEDWRGELEARLQRLRKAQKPEWVIRREAIKCFLELIWAAICINWENLWLPKSKGVDK